jgi:hypothetical protein
MKRSESSDDIDDAAAAHAAANNGARAGGAAGPERERQQAERAPWSAGHGEIVIVRLFKFEFAFVLLSET